jgi:hypothetical protein
MKPPYVGYEVHGEGRGEGEERVKVRIAFDHFKRYEQIKSAPRSSCRRSVPVNSRAAFPLTLLPLTWREGPPLTRSHLLTLRLRPPHREV